MPDITIVHFSIFALLFTVGAAFGWIMRGDRCARERIAVNAEWQERMEAQDREQANLAEQNRHLLQSVDHHKAAQKDTAQRTEELTKSLKEAVTRRDDLHRQIKDIRLELDDALRQRDRLKADAGKQKEQQDQATADLLQDRNRKIFKLSHELASWHNRLPPLVERFRQRDEQARELQSRLDLALERIAVLEGQRGGERTRIEAVDPDSLSHALDASNDQYDETPEVDLSDLQDQIADQVPGSLSEAIPAMDGTSWSIDNIDRHRMGANAGDDLKMIKGIGPAIERTLNDLGFFRFEQIAAISEYDINRIAARLKGFRSRIYREDWIGQARTLRQLQQHDPA